MSYEILILILIIPAAIILYSILKTGKISFKLIWLVLSLPFRVVLGILFDLDKIRNEFKKGYQTFDKSIDSQELPEKTSFDKGTEFEKYVENILFPKSQYNLVEKTHSYDTNTERYVESSMNPDYKFRDKKTNRDFWVEVKYRSRFYKGKVEWCSSPNQLTRYRQSAMKAPFFLVLGISGEPNNPNYISLIHMTKKQFKFRHLYLREVESYSINPKVAVSSNQLWD